METTWTQNVVRITVVRLIVVAFTIVAFGFLFFRLSVFDLRVLPSQFVTSGVTASVFLRRWRRPGEETVYRSSRLVRRPDVSCRPVYAVAGKCVWCIRCRCRRGGLRLQQLRPQGDCPRWVQRVASAGVLTAIANAVIMVYVGLFSWHTVFASAVFSRRWSSGIFNSGRW